MFKLRRVILFSLAVILGAWWWHNQESPTTMTLVEQNAPLLVLHNVTSFHFDEKGVREVILTTPQLTHYDDVRGSDYLQPVVNYLHGEQRMRIRGNEGHLDEHKTLLTFKGDVISEEFINNLRLRWLETTVLNYNLPLKVADTDADVKITTPESLTFATGATWHVREESFILKENVRSKYESKNQP